MRGHQSLINCRLNKVKPSIVFLMDSGADTDYWKTCDYMNLVFEIDISEDRPEQTDLRFLIGLHASFDCKTKDRAEAFFEQAQKFNPAVVVASCWNNSRDNLFIFKSGDFIRRIENKHELLT